MEELAAEHGPYTAERAAYDQARYLDGIATDHLRELTYLDRKALHNFKYFTWVEQQGRTADELRELWEPEFWDRTFAQVDEWDEQINDVQRADAACWTCSDEIDFLNRRTQRQRRYEA